VIYNPVLMNNIINNIFSIKIIHKLVESKPNSNIENHFINRFMYQSFLELRNKNGDV
jgi:hypothetical protein